jgi:hypothetical protein
MILHRQKVASSIVCIVVLALPHFSHAQQSAASVDLNSNNYGPQVPLSSTPTDSSKFVPLAQYDKSPQFKKVFDSGSLPAYINALFTAILSIGAILAVLRIAYGGYMYMGSADMWGNKQQAKEIIGEAIIGLLLLLSIYLILNVINPNLLNLNVLKDISQVPSNNPETNNALQQASIQLQQQNQDNTASSPADYTPSLSSTPIKGSWCFATQLTSGAGYSCVTNSANCNSLAKTANETCTQY